MYDTIGQRIATVVLIARGAGAIGPFYTSRDCAEKSLFRRDKYACSGRALSVISRIRRVDRFVVCACNRSGLPHLLYALARPHVIIDEVPLLVFGAKPRRRMRQTSNFQSDGYSGCVMDEMQARSEF